jgi:putative phosphoesterase
MTSPALDIGVISDTHGLLRPEVVEELRGSNLIVHAGDVGKPHILDELRALAPLVAVRGNVDHGRWAEALPLREVVEAGPLLLYVLHEMEHLDLDPAAAEFAAVITGHTHRPHAETRNGILYLNPGSVGPRRFRLPVTMARLRVRGSTLEHRLIELEI